MAKEAGATRFCMGAAWREVHDGEAFDQVLAMVRGVRELGLEACVTLGMLTQDQADRLAAAGLTAYNHNLDTSPEFYGEIITTRTYQERLDTLACVRAAGVTICSGGIIGMGESESDRARMLQILAGLDPHPESVPINALVPVPGTPLADRPPVEAMEMVRMVATARIVMPEDARTALGRPPRARQGGAAPVLHGRRQLDLLRRQAAHHGQQRHARRSRPHRRSRIAGPRHKARSLSGRVPSTFVRFIADLPATPHL